MISFLPGAVKITIREPPVLISVALLQSTAANARTLPTLPP